MRLTDRYHTLVAQSAQPRECFLRISGDELAGRYLLKHYI